MIVNIVVSDDDMVGDKDSIKSKKVDLQSIVTSMIKRCCYGRHRLKECVDELELLVVDVVSNKSKSVRVELDAGDKFEEFTVEGHC